VIGIVSVHPRPGRLAPIYALVTLAIAIGALTFVVLWYLFSAGAVIVSVVNVGVGWIDRIVRIDFHWFSFG
jgi:hypothetical protein